jgi:glycosyltransferase involved in cell wall biosynthesis
MRLVQASLYAGVRTVAYLRDVEFGRAVWNHAAMRDCLLLANSHFVAARAFAQFGIRCRVIPPFIAPGRYATQTTRQTALFVNPIPKKGVEIAIYLARSFPKLHFDFVESWPMDVLRRRYYVDSIKMLPNISRHLPVRDMRVFYARARLVLMPSLWEEGWGRIVAEAQQSGIPSIASLRGGLPEAVGKAGILVESYMNIDSWRDAVQLMMESDADYERLSNAAFAQAHERDESSDDLISALIETIR